MSAVFAFCFGRGQGAGVKDWVWSVLGSAWRSLELARPEGCGPRTLFDNFIGRKRDVDGGVLAGLLGNQKPGRDKLTVTFQTTISSEAGL